MKHTNHVEYVSVVVPVYNEEGCLQELIDRTLKTLDGCGRKFEFILVDDGSRDRSAEIMKKASEARPGEVVSCILNRNYGQHSAIMAGFSLVRGGDAGRGSSESAGGDSEADRRRGRGQ